MGILYICIYVVQIKIINDKDRVVPAIMCCEGGGFCHNESDVFNLSSWAFTMSAKVIPSQAFQQAQYLYRCVCICCSQASEEVDEMEAT